MWKVGVRHGCVCMQHWPGRLTGDTGWIYRIPRTRHVATAVARHGTPNERQGNGTLALYQLFRLRERTPRPCSVCGPRRLSRRGDRRLVGARFGRWREDTFGRGRCLTLRYSLPLSVWVDSLAEHIRVSVCSTARDAERETLDGYIKEVFERSRSKSWPLEKTRSKVANPVELSWGFDRGC